jgi:hypothetical protein
MKEQIVDILNDNKAEGKKFSLRVRKLMQSRRGLIRELWHKERLNFMQLDMIIQMKLDKEGFKKIMEEITMLQKLTHKFLKLGKNAGAVRLSMLKMIRMRHQKMLAKPPPITCLFVCLLICVLQGTRMYLRIILAQFYKFQ